MTMLQSIYDKSPYWIQNSLLNLYAIGIHKERYGKNFNIALQNLRESQWFSLEQIKEYQLEKVKILIEHAYETVPFYKERYREHGVHPKDIKELSDMSKLPILTREDVKAAGDKLISSLYPKNKLFHGHTSGTTGSPLSCYWDKQTCVYNNAADWRQKEWAGIKRGDGIALFLGPTIIPTSKTTPPLWQLDRIHNMLWMSSFHLSEEHLPHHINKLREFRPAAIEGYPSTTYVLARYLKSINQTLPLKAVFTSSETLLPQQKSLIEERFEAPIFDFYGMAERVAFASQCPEAHEYHLNFEFALNEIVDNDNNTVESGKEGYLVGTSLHNFGMPFIRYKTSDITAINYEQCSCGRYMPRFEGITTKDEDIVVTPEGKLVSSSVLTHPFKPLESIQESQIIQEEIDLIRVNIVRREEYSKDDSKHLIAALHERVGPRMRIELNFVESIPRTKSGKFRWVISKVALPI
jgi:phenylacetate-CoA ligase